MSRRQGGDDGAPGWKAAVILGGAALLGVGVVSTFNSQAASVGIVSSGPAGTDASKSGKSTTTSGTAPAITTTSTLPLKPAADVKVLLANGTSTKGATDKVKAALRPACYSLPVAINATSKVVAENRTVTVVYSTPGFEREATLIRNLLQLPTGSDAALPDPPPIPTKGVPTYNVLIVVAKDLVENPPPPLSTGATCAANAGGSTTSSSGASGGSTTTRRATAGSSTSRATASSTTTTTRARATTTTTKATTTTT